MPKYIRTFYRCDRCDAETEAPKLPPYWAVFAAIGANGALKYGNQYSSLSADNQIGVLCSDCAQGLSEFLEKQ